MKQIAPHESSLRLSLWKDRPTTGRSCFFFPSLLEEPWRLRNASSHTGLSNSTGRVSRSSCCRGASRSLTNPPKGGGWALKDGARPPLCPLPLSLECQGIPQKWLFLGPCPPSAPKLRWARWGGPSRLCPGPTTSFPSVLQEELYCSVPSWPHLHLCPPGLTFLRAAEEHCNKQQEK